LAGGQPSAYIFTLGGAQSGVVFHVYLAYQVKLLVLR
jgi:hypothetical protein